MSRSPQQSPTLTQAWLVLVAVLFLVLVGLALAGAELAAHLDAAPDATPYRARYPLWATLLLFTAALGCYLLMRAGTVGVRWRPFWTFAYFSYLLYAVWAYLTPAGGDVARLFRGG